MEVKINLCARTQTVSKRWTLSKKREIHYFANEFLELILRWTVCTIDDDPIDVAEAITPNTWTRKSFVSGSGVVTKSVCLMPTLSFELSDSIFSTYVGSYIYVVQGTYKWTVAIKRVISIFMRLPKANLKSLKSIIGAKPKKHDTMMSVNRWRFEAWVAHLKCEPLENVLNVLENTFDFFLLLIYTASRRSTWWRKSIMDFLFVSCSWYANSTAYSFHGLFRSRHLAGINLIHKQQLQHQVHSECEAMENLRITLTVYFMTKIMALSFHNAPEAHYYNRENCASAKTSSRQMDNVKLWTVRAPWAQSTEVQY